MVIVNIKSQGTGFDMEALQLSEFVIGSLWVNWFNQDHYSVLNTKTCEMHNKRKIPKHHKIKWVNNSGGTNHSSPRDTHWNTHKNNNSVMYKTYHEES